MNNEKLSELIEYLRNFGAELQGLSDAPGIQLRVLSFASGRLQEVLAKVLKVLAEREAEP